MSQQTERSLLDDATTFTFFLDDDRDSIDAYHLAVSCRWSGRDMWAVTQMGFCLNHEGKWEYEPIPSSRDDAFLARCRFTRDEAIALAREHAGRSRVGGKEHRDE